MQFKGEAGELLLLEEVSAENCYLLKDSSPTSLSIIWSREAGSILNIDGQDFELKRDQLIFLTEFHRVQVKMVTDLRLVRFNRAFYCIIDHDHEVSCRGLLFFGASQVPHFTISTEDKKKLDLIWQTMLTEMEADDHYQSEMLQTMLKRLIIVCTRMLREKKNLSDLDNGQLDMVREFNFQVENHFRTMHTVAEYADLLNRSPKTLSNYFRLYAHKTPLQIIQERIALEARRMLHYTEQPVKEIAYELGFEDLQSFSRFFKSKEGLSPKDFREKQLVRKN